MSFSIYHQAGACFTRVATLKLTGQEGVLAKFLRDHAEAETPFAWQFSDTQLIALARPDLNSHEHLVVLDLLPESFCEVCLYHVRTLKASLMLMKAMLCLLVGSCFRAQFRSLPSPSSSASRASGPRGLGK
jgi:hypothetical protein